MSMITKELQTYVQDNWGQFAEPVREVSKSGSRENSRLPQMDWHLPENGLSWSSLKQDLKRKLQNLKLFL